MKPRRAPAAPAVEPAQDLLLEIGVEELPARFVPAALRDLKAVAVAAFEAAGLDRAAVETLGTPRRLALLVTALAARSKDAVRESLGPSLAQAKDAQGDWTPAALGFAKSQGAAPEALEVRRTDKGDRLCAVHRQEGAPAAKLLPDLLPGIIRKIPFAKNMVWEASRFSFARPIRWIAAFHGTKPVRFTLADVKAGTKTQGLRVHGNKPLALPAPAKYRSFLRDRCVIADPAERRALIEKQIQQAVKAAHGAVRPEADAALFEEVTHLVEHPVAILARFDPRFLALPEEVLVTSMKKHQKFFPVFAAEEKSGAVPSAALRGQSALSGSANAAAHGLLPCFVGVRNGVSENQSVVREGYERVLAARLADAEFFFAQDRKTTLESKAELLKDVQFQKELGSVWEKSRRVIQLAGALTDRLGLGRELSHEAPRIAFLAKADLVTAMVGEFPELQGVMGRIYAAADGESATVAQGVEQHYWPLTAEGALPESPAAAVVSLADKLDTLAGDFLVGLVPSGSQDPYGLRRAAVGVLRILQERRWKLDLADVLDAALSAFPLKAGAAPSATLRATGDAARHRPGLSDGAALSGNVDAADPARTRRALLDFFRQRWCALLEARGFRFDEVQAVVTSRFDDVVDAEARLTALRDGRRRPGFSSVSAAFKRAGNILSQARKKDLFSADTVISPERLREDAEKDLFQALLRTENALPPLLAAADYAAAFRNLEGLRGGVDTFFEKVMVMAPEEDLRANRLALLSRVTALFRHVADLSCLQDVPAPDGEADGA